MFDVIMDMIKDFPKELSLGRMAESAVLLTIIWQKLKPELRKLEDLIAQGNSTMRDGFATGDKRFKDLEDRVSRLEKPEGGTNGNFKQAAFARSPS